MDERQTLLAVVQELPEEQFQGLKLLLEGQIPAGPLLAASRPELCRLLGQRFPGRALALLAGILRGLGRHDLVQRFQLLPEEPIPPGTPDGSNPPLQIPAGIPDAVPTPRLLTEKELMGIAQKLGREWQQVGIQCLGLERSRLEQIQEENPGNPVLWSFQMLLEWRRRARGEATARGLRELLEQLPVDPEILALLRSFEGS